MRKKVVENVFENVMGNVIQNLRKRGEKHEKDDFCAAYTGAAAALSFLPVQDCLPMGGRQLVL